MRTTIAFITILFCASWANGIPNQKESGPSEGIFSGPINEAFLPQMDAKDLKQEELSKLMIEYSDVANEAFENKDEIGKPFHLLSERTLRLQDKATNLIYDIAKIVSKPKYASMFLKSSGFSLDITPYIVTNNNKTKLAYLHLINLLFTVDPENTKKYIPKQLIDILLQTIATKKEKPMRDYCIDILTKWLPQSPRVQQRLIEYNGIEVFYRQIFKSDYETFFKLLNLLIKVIIEHKNTFMTEDKDSSLYQEYSNVGLLKFFSKLQPCLALVRIYSRAWNIGDDKFINPVFTLMRVMRNHCKHRYANKQTAMKLFKKMNDAVHDESKAQFFSKLGLKVGEIRNLTQEYVEASRPHSDITEL